MYQIDHPGLNSLGFRCLGTSSRLLGLVYMESTCEEHDNNKNAWEAKRSVCNFLWGTESPRQHQHPRLPGANSNSWGRGRFAVPAPSLRASTTVLWGVGTQQWMGLRTELQFLHLWNEGWALTTLRSVITFPLLLFYTEGTEAEYETMS